MDQEVTPKTYWEVFQQNSDGEKILTQLHRQFYDVSPYTKGDPYDTAFKCGQQEVVRFIIGQIHQAMQPEREQEQLYMEE